MSKIIILAVVKAPPHPTLSVTANDWSSGITKQQTLELYQKHRTCRKPPYAHALHQRAPFLSPTRPPVPVYPTHALASLIAHPTAVCIETHSRLPCMHAAPAQSVRGATVIGTAARRVRENASVIFRAWGAGCMLFAGGREPGRLLGAAARVEDLGWGD
jgi:hypothetical protein